MLYNNDVMHKTVIKFIITHIKIKILPQKKKKGKQYSENITSIRFVGPLNLKKGSPIHKFSNLDLSKGVTPLNVVLPKP
jgi:hypothetical protein